MRRWLKGEPTLKETLEDPVIQLMMRRDRVDPDHLQALMHEVASRARDAEKPAEQQYRRPTKSTGM